MIPAQCIIMTITNYIILSECRGVCGVHADQLAIDSMNMMRLEGLGFVMNNIQ